MAIKSGCLLTKVFILLILLSMYEVSESRFVWDFGSYCLNYCAKIKFKLSSVSICSCQWISSNHQRSTTVTDLYVNDEELEPTKTFLIK